MVATPAHIEKSGPSSDRAPRLRLTVSPSTGYPIEKRRCAKKRDTDPAVPGRTAETWEGVMAVARSSRAITPISDNGFCRTT